MKGMRSLGDRTLYHLAACLGLSEHLAGEGDDETVGPPDSSWADLLAAIMEGFERGWVQEAHLTREDGQTHLRWGATDRGERAVAAFKRRDQ